MGSVTSREKRKHGTPRRVRMLYVFRLEMQRVSGATSEILSNMIAAYSRARAYLQAMLLRVCFFRPPAIDMKHDCGKKNARHEAFVCHASSIWKCSVLPSGEISEIRNPFRAKFPTRLQLYEQRKMQDTKRSYVMRAPFGNAAHSRMAQQAKSFQIRLSRRARASCCMCDVVFFSPAGQSS